MVNETHSERTAVDGDGFKIRVDREQLTREQLYAMARPEFQSDVQQLLETAGTLMNSAGTLSLEDSGDASNPKKTLKLEKDGSSINLQRGVLVSFLKQHATELREGIIPMRAGVTPDRSIIASLTAQYETILDIVMAEEDRIRAEGNVPRIVAAYGAMKVTAARFKGWLIATGVALATSTSALAHYAGDEIQHDFEEVGNSIGEGIDDAQRDFGRWWKDLIEDAKPKKKPRSKK